VHVPGFTYPPAAEKGAVAEGEAPLLGSDDEGMDPEAGAGGSINVAVGGNTPGHVNSDLVIGSTLQSLMESPNLSKATLVKKR
jgi:hypothetical protein